MCAYNYHAPAILAICLASLAFAAAVQPVRAQGPTIAYDTPDHNPQIAIYPDQLERIDSVQVRGFTRWSFTTPPELDGVPGYKIDHEIIRVQVNCMTHTSTIASAIAYPADTSHRQQLMFGKYPGRGVPKPWDMPAPKTAPYKAIAKAMCKAAGLPAPPRPAPGPSQDL
jgi:hypothetical protein